MALDLWFPEDIVRILASTHAAMTASLEAASTFDANVAAYEQGFTDALRALSVAFGLAPPGETGGVTRGIPGSGSRNQVPPGGATIIPPGP